MRRSRAQIVGALAVLLVLSNLECIAACLVSPCGTVVQVANLPPCHRQQPASGSQDRSHCPRQTWLSAEKTAPSLVSGALQPCGFALPAPIAGATYGRAVPSGRLPLDHSPPGSPILRI